VPVVGVATAFGGNKMASALRGLVYFISEGTSSFPDLAGRKPKGALFTDRFAISARDFQTGFPGVDDRLEKTRASARDARRSRARSQVLGRHPSSHRPRRTRRAFDRLTVPPPEQPPPSR
jgi:hypothetical protein